MLIVLLDNNRRVSRWLFESCSEDSPMEQCSKLRISLISQGFTVFT